MAIISACLFGSSGETSSIFRMEPSSLPPWLPCVLDRDPVANNERNLSDAALGFGVCMRPWVFEERTGRRRSGQRRSLAIDEAAVLFEIDRCRCCLLSFLLFDFHAFNFDKTLSDKFQRFFLK